MLTACNSTWWTNEDYGPLVIGGSAGAVPQVDMAVAGEAVDALVICIVRIEQIAHVGLVNELLSNPVVTAREGQSIAGAAL